MSRGGGEWRGEGGGGRKATSGWRWWAGTSTGEEGRGGEGRGGQGEEGDLGLAVVSGDVDR